MLAAATSGRRLEQDAAGGWWFERWASSRRVVAGITDRRLSASELLAAVVPTTTVEAEQVHDGAIAMIERRRDAAQWIPGCDALLTSLSGVALLIRTADCLPIFFSDPSRGVVGLAHVGWRGLAAQLPMRMVAAFRHLYRSGPAELRIAIGPSIRACCYEVDSEFAARFGSHVRQHGGRRTCDLIGVAIDQLRRSGVRADRILDAERCTACEPQHWFSLRREGAATGRLTSVIMLRP